MLQYIALLQSAIRCDDAIHCHTLQYFTLHCNDADLSWKAFLDLEPGPLPEIEKYPCLLWWEIQRNVCQKFNSEWFMILQYHPFKRCYPAINKLHWDDADLSCKTVLDIDFILILHLSTLMSNKSFAVLKGVCVGVILGDIVDILVHLSFKHLQ